MTCVLMTKDPSILMKNETKQTNGKNGEACINTLQLYSIPYTIEEEEIRGLCYVRWQVEARAIKLLQFPPPSPKAVVKLVALGHAHATRWHYIVYI